MNLYRWCLIFIILLTSAAYSQFNSYYQQCDLSKTFIEKYKAQDFEGIYEMFDSTMKAQIQVPTLKQIQTQLLSQVGELDTIVEQNCITEGEYITCINTVHFAKGELNFLLSYNKENQVAGFYIQPVIHKSNYILPEYADTTKFERKSLKFGKNFPLDAELTLPIGKKDVPCIIFVQGSGPNDMDETIYDNKPFKDLAYGLSSNGIATFRYNKRTNQYGKELSKSIDTMTLNSEVLEDVVLAYKFVKKQKGIDASRIYILGHSLGGYVIPKIAELLPKAAGFIMLAGSARPLEDLLIDQTQYISELPNSQISQEQLKEIKELIEKIRNEDFSFMKSPTDYPFAMPPTYWKYLHSYDHIKLANQINRPVLILQGERDYQVTMKDYQIWKSAFRNNKDAQFKSYPGLNHLFLEGTEKSTPDEYQKAGHIPFYVIEDIINWINNNN